MRRPLTVIYLLVVAVGVAAQMSTQTAKNFGERVRREAFANPFSEDKLKALMAALPKDQDLYVVEGDLLLTEQELRAYVVVQSQSEKPVDAGAELIVNVHNGQRDYYKDRSLRTLSYAVDRQSFPDEEYYKTTVENMRIATKDWQDACSNCFIEFKHNEKFDLQPPQEPSKDSVNFLVRFRDVGGAYIAAAFFPHDAPVRRYLNIDPSYFSSNSPFDKAGVLRHELGHVLGYRHEHTRGIPDCYYEDKKWQPLTDYDPKSVMHYFCGGGGSLTLKLSDTDVVGHRKLYEVTAGSNGFDFKRFVRVRFDGPEVTKVMAEVLGILTRQGLIETKAYTVVELGENLTSVYEKNLGLTEVPRSLIDYAETLNKGVSRKGTLKAGEEIRYPHITLKPYERLVVLDENDPKDQQRYKDIKASWPDDFRREIRKGESTIALFLKAYELVVEFDSRDKEIQARTELLTFKSETKSKYSVFGGANPSMQQFPIYTLSPEVKGPRSSALYPAPGRSVMLPPDNQTPQEFLSLVRNNSGRVSVGVEGDLSLYFGALDFPPPPAPCEQNSPPDCPEIILIDSVVSKHPDIPSAIEGGSGVPGEPPIDNTTNPNQQKINIGDGDGVLRSQHGTYMAGIIASQPNGFGLIGVNPRATIVSFDWDAVTPAGPDEIRNFGQFISARQSRFLVTSANMPIFVFATEWPFRDDFNSDAERFDSSMQNNPDVWRSVASAIKEARPLVVVAAGQAVEGTPKSVINKRSKQGPRNLGDLENVIVVTSLDERLIEGMPAIWDAANFTNENEPLKLVHVAAPGQHILSTIPNVGSANGAASYAVASGTSPATAFVAGVVSAMISAYPARYQEPRKLKARLQLTSDPFLTVRDVGKLAAGIVDMNLALRDPKKDWFKTSGPGSFVEITNPRWLVDRISLLPPDRDPEKAVSIETKRIQRLMFRNGVCYIYTSDASKPGQIRKYGPGTIRQQDILALKLVRLSRGGQSREYSLSEIEDLVLLLPTSDRTP